MAQVDLRPLSNLPEKAEPRPELSLFSNGKNGPSPNAGPARIRVRLTGAQWTNLAFVVCACLGALFSAAYLFKGGEILQEVAAWPRELFHGHPIPAAPVQSDNPGIVGEILPPQLANQAIATRNDSGDPFSPAIKLLNPPHTAALRPNGTRTNAPSSLFFKQLNMPLSTGDNLSNALTQGAPNPAPTLPTGMPNGSSAQDTAVAKAEAAKTSAISQIQTSKARMATAAKNTSVRNAAHSSSIRTASRSITNAKPSFFQSLFGFNPKRSSASRTGRTSARVKTSTLRAAKIARQSGFARRSNVAASRATFRARNTASTKSLTKSVTQKIQTSRQIARSTRTTPRSTSKIATLPASTMASPSLKSSGLSGITQPAASLGSIGSAGRGIGSGSGIGGMKMGHVFGRAGGR